MKRLYNFVSTEYNFKVSVPKTHVPYNYQGLFENVMSNVKIAFVIILMYIAIVYVRSYGRHMLTFILTDILQEFVSLKILIIC